MKIIILLFLLTSLLFSFDQEELNLLDDLNNASNISTKTKLNINQTPAIVSVLHARELQKLGITDVFTALETVPGIEVSMGIAGAKQINMRGNKSLVTDKVKFMIDGISINSELSGSNHFYLNMPIENIQRIEIIRGPASALYGSFAHIGVINIITKLSTHKASTSFLRSSSQDSNNIGFTQHANSKDVKIAFSGSFESNKNSRQYSNYTSPLLSKDTQYTSYEDFTALTLGVKMEFAKNISLTSRYLQEDTQNYFGYGAWPIVQDPKELQHTSFINELRYEPVITNYLHLDAKVGFKYYALKGSSRLRPLILVGSPNDLIGEGDYGENSIYTDLALNYTFNQHNIIIGTYIARTKAKNTSYEINNPSISEDTDVSIEGGGLKDNIKRAQYALYLSGLYNLNTQWSANAGLRYDYYSDTDSALSPKLALLYNLNEKQSYKLMYQRSFRVPSFTELYATEIPFIGDENLKSETIDTLEFAYHYQDSFDSWFSINFFYSDMQNFITRDASYQLVNTKDTLSYGLELEFKYPIFDATSLQANYSYVFMEDKDGIKTPLISNHLANIMLSYRLSSHWHTGSKIRYVGEKAREEADTRDPLSAYTTFDQTVTYTIKELVLQASVKNIFDADVIYPAPLGNGGNILTSGSSGTYEDDLAQNGRTLWLSAEWRWR